MPRSESHVYSFAHFAYPEELVGVNSATVKVYFLTQTTTPANVRFKIILNSNNAGEVWNSGGWSGATAAVPVSGTTNILYVQTFEFTSLPFEGDLFTLAIGRDLYNGDTYDDAVFLHAIKIEPNTGISAMPGDMPARNLDLAVMPNPFNPVTEISFELPENGPTTVEVFDVRGRLVDTLCAGRHLSAGRHQFTWQPESLPSGTYVISVETSGMVETMKVGLVK